MTKLFIGLLNLSPVFALLMFGWMVVNHFMVMSTKYHSGIDTALRLSGG